MESWQVRKAIACILCNLKTDHKLLSIGLEPADILATIPRFNLIESPDTGWRLFRYEFTGKGNLPRKEMLVACYRKRILIMYDISQNDRFVTVDTLVRGFIDDDPGAGRLASKRYGDEVSGEIMSILTGFFVIQDVFTYPVILADDMQVTKGATVSSQPLERLGAIGSELPDFRATTFTYRILNAETGTTGYIRISRHLTLGLRLRGQVLYDLIGILFEVFLYKRYDQLTNEDVFNALAKVRDFTVPTEINIFFQEMAVRLAVFGSILAVALSLVNSLASMSHLSVKQATIAYAFMLLVAWPIWRVAAAIVRNIYSS